MNGPAVRLVPGDQRVMPDAAAIRLLASARGALQPVLGDHAHRQRLLGDFINWDRVLLAYEGPQPVGFATCKYAGRGPFAPPPAAFRQTFGPVSGLLRRAAYRFAEWREGRHRFFLYSLKVIPQARGRGIASALLRATEQLALRNGFDAVELEVFAGNAPARQLYARQGYRIVRRIDLRWAARFVSGGPVLYRMRSPRLFPA